VRLGFCKACKRQVSREAASCPGCGQPEPSQPVPDEILMLIARRHIIEAIKRIREVSRFDLREAKEFVEGLEQERRRTGPW